MGYRYVVCCLSLVQAFRYTEGSAALVHDSRLVRYSTVVPPKACEAYRIVIHSGKTIWRKRIGT